MRATFYDGLLPFSLDSKKREYNRMASVLLPFSSSLEESAVKEGFRICIHTKGSRFDSGIQGKQLRVISDNPRALQAWCKTDHVLPHKISPRFYFVPHANPTVKPRGPVPYFNMNQIRSIYAIPALKQSYVVGVVSFGGGLYGSVSAEGLLTNGDVQAYWSALGIPAANHPRVIVVPILGAKNAPSMNDGGSTFENTLDVETVGGACPSSNLTIILYIAPNRLSAFPDLLNYMYSTTITVGGIPYKPNLISCSWGAPEIYYSASLRSSIDSILAKINAAGINMCAATGDNGSNDGVGGRGNYVDFPSSHPYVLAVGGTTLVCPNGVYDSKTKETAWSSGGGGISVAYSKPSYQTAAWRSTPDIACIADPNTGVVFIINGRAYVIGGTSVASPVMAGYLAAINYRNWIHPKLYKAKNGFHDVTGGSNGGYSAKAGYDNCTGLGSVNGAVLSSFL